MKKKREIKAERTKIDKIAFEVLDELGLLKRDDTYVSSIAAVVEIVSDSGCPIEPPDDSLVVVTPGGVEELEEVAQNTNIRLCPLQVLLLPLQAQLVFLRLLLVIGCRFRQQICKLHGEELGFTELLHNQRARIRNMTRGCFHLFYLFQLIRTSWKLICPNVCYEIVDI